MIARRSTMRRVRFGSRYLPRRAGSAVAFRLGKLTAGTSRTFDLTVRVRRSASGTLTNRARAFAAGIGPVEASAETRVVPASSGE